MENLQREIREALRAYLEDEDDDAPLMELIARHPEITEKSTGNYPDVHRLMDVIVGDKIFRAIRKISEGERIVLEPVNFFREEMGMPLWVTGEALKRWAEEEENDPQKEEELDWHRFFLPESKAK